MAGFVRVTVPDKEPALVEMVRYHRAVSELESVHFVLVLKAY